MSEVSRAAMEAAVELEISNCIGGITTRGLAEHIEKVGRAVVQDNEDKLRKALQAALVIAGSEWNFPGAHPHRAAVLQQMKDALT